MEILSKVGRPYDNPEFIKEFQSFLDQNRVCKRLIVPMGTFTNNGWSLGYVEGFGFTSEGLTVLRRIKGCEQPQQQLGIHSKTEFATKTEDLEICLKHALGN